MKIIALGDIFGSLGRNLIKKELPNLKKKYEADLVIANIENATNGKGLSKDHYLELSKYIDIMTSGNHIFFLEETKNFISESPNLLRPLNINPYHPGSGTFLLKVKNKKIRITNLIGVSLMGGSYENPFFSFESLLEFEKTNEENKSDIHLIDFHAETTAEKAIFANAFDGLITAFWGTHTHVQTNDDRILPKGTAFISDLGMVGSLDGIIGADPACIIKRSKFGMSSRMIPYCKGRKQINGILLEINENTNSAVSIKKIKNVFD